MKYRYSSEEALITDMYASACEWLPDHSNGEMLLVMVGKLNVVAESNYLFISNYTCLQDISN